MKKISIIILTFILIGACGSTSKNIKEKVSPPSKVVILKTSPLNNDTPSIESVYYYAVAMLNMYNRNFKNAEKAFLKALEENPDSPYLNYRMATFYLHFQNIQKAVKYCERSLLKNPNFKKAHELLANIYAATNNIKGAISEYEFLLKRKPDNPTLLLKYGIFLLMGEQFEKAKKTFKTLIKNKKFQPTGYYYLGKTYSKIKLFREALKYYKKATELKPDFEQAYYEMGLVYQLEGKDEKAYKTYLKVLEINPDNILAREKIVRYFVKKNDLTGALKHLKKLKDLEGDNININIKLALVYIELKEYKKAIEILKKFSEFPKAQYYEITAYLKLQDIKNALKILQKINQSSNYYFDSAVIVINYLIDAGKFNDALNTYLKVIDNLENKNLKIYKFGLFLFDKAKEYKRGIEFIDDALKKYPNVSEFYFYRGLFYDKLGNLKMVIDSMKKAINVNHKSSDALNYLGYTYAIHKMKLNEAENLIKEALKLKPDSAAITDSLGWVYFQKNEFQKALRFLKKAYELDGGFQAEIIYHLGKVYLKLNKMKLAKKYLKEALSKSADKDLNEKIKKSLEEIK